MHSHAQPVVYKCDLFATKWYSIIITTHLRFYEPGRVLDALTPSWPGLVNQTWVVCSTQQVGIPTGFGCVGTDNKNNTLQLYMHVVNIGEHKRRAARFVRKRRLERFTTWTPRYGKGYLTDVGHQVAACQLGVGVYGRRNEKTTLKMLHMSLSLVSISAGWLGVFPRGCLRGSLPKQRGK